MSQVQQLLESAASGWKNMQSDAAKLAAKWEVTGLLEGLRSETDKNNMSLILENQAKQLVVEQSSVGGGGTTIPPMGPGNNATAQMMVLQKALSEGQAHVTIQVPDADVGLIIGKGGMQIRNIQERSGANIQISQVADADNPAVRTVNITHPNKEGGEFAKQMISEILATKMNTPDAMGGPRVGAGDTTIQVNVSILLIFLVGFVCWCEVILF